MNFETGMYYDSNAATEAVDRLHALGYAQDEISVIMDDKTRERAFAAITNVKGSEGVAAGATIGGILGAIIAGATATGTVLMTGGAAAPIVVGPLAAALAGLGTGALGGGIVGGLIGVGIGEARAKHYEKGLHDGAIVLAVRPKSKDHVEHLRGALRDEARTSTGEIEPAHTDYAGSVDVKRPMP
jgi:hypothetical protein